MISNVKIFAYELPQELLNDLRRRILRNLGREIALYPVSLPEKKLGQEQLKST